ncbi:MAG TPA: hypothetical protein PLK64_11350, partial [Dermatophilaceae bacterium]|nr:hypothetical protein [Dermatophilaceae bacterium]
KSAHDSGNGCASFTISSVTGFRLNNFKVDNFDLFPSGTPLTALAATATTAPVLFPTADLASPLKGAVTNSATVGTSITVVFNDVNGVGLRPETIRDSDPEFDLLVNGSPSTVTVNGIPTAVAGKVNTWTYTLSGALPADGLVTVRFRQAGFSDLGGSMNMSEDEQFVLFTPTPTNPRPGPVAQLANPSGGGTITAAQINAQRYIDVTYTSVPAATGGVLDPIIKSSIETSVAPFKITGAGIADLALDPVTGAPLIVGQPLLISGRAATATTVTYRYFLKDKNTANTIGMFTSGAIQVEFFAERIRSGPVDGTYVSKNAAQSQSFTINASAPGAATTGGPIALGPLTLQGPSVGLADFGFADGMVVLTIAVGVDRASLNFGGSATNNTTTPTTAQSNSGITVDLIGILGTFDLAVDVFGLLGGNVRVEPTGKWNLRVASLEAEIPNLAKLTAEGILVGYDPAADDSQELIRINSATLTLPKFGITGSIRPYDPAQASNIAANNIRANDEPMLGVIPGLSIRGNGFSLGTAELAYGLPPEAGGLTPSSGVVDEKITFGGILELADIRVGVSGLTVTFGTETTFTGLIYIASGGAKLFPNGAFGATISDRLTADDRRPDGTADTEAFRIAVTFAAGKVQAFQMSIDTLEVRLGTFVTLTARDFLLDTGAAGTSDRMVQFGSIGAKVTIGALVIGGEGRNFAIRGDGTFEALQGFGVFLSVGSATGDSFQWPSFLPVRIDALGIQWVDIQNAPEDFVLTLSATVTGIKGMSGLEFSGSIQGVKIAPALLAQGKFPIIAIDSIAVQVKGKMFGGELEAGLVGGILRLDSNFAIIGTFDTTTPVAQRIFYLGISGGFSIAGMAGLTIRIGLSELGPLQVFINVEVPGGVLLEPTTGLTLNDFSAGVEFFKTLPSIDDPLALRSSAFGLPTNLTADQWMAGLQSQVALQAKAISLNPSQSGFEAAFTSPMVITGSARVYSIYTSQAVFNGLVMVKISTDGKILISGTLNFADNNISISGRLYADLSRVATGDVVVLFLADVPDQVRLLTIYGKLKMGFRNSSGQEVTFDVVDVPDPAATVTAPTVNVAAPVGGGGTIDVSLANAGSGERTIDVTFTPPAGASLDIASILDSAQEFTLTVNGVTRTITSGIPVPIIAVTTSEGVIFVPLESDGTKVTYTYRKPGESSDTIETVVTLASLPTGSDLMTEAIRISGTTRFRYAIGSAQLPLGTVALVFTAGGVKNRDVTTTSGTTVGAGNAATTVSFTVTGVSAVVVDPGPGGTVDIAVVNNRPWLTFIDVDFTVGSGRTIDLASILDLAPEISLGGSGLGSAALDGTRVPIVLSVDATTGTVRVRFWTTGAFAASGTVTVTPLLRTWAFTATLSAATLASVTIPANTSVTTIAVTIPGVTADMASLNGLSFVDLDAAAPGVQLYAASGQIVTLDTSRAIVWNGSAFLIPVIATSSTAPELEVEAQIQAGTVSWTSAQDSDYTGRTAAVAPATVTGATTYIDVTFSPSMGALLTQGSINGDEILLTGVGAAGISLVSGGAVYLHGTTWRFALSGQFAIGAVNVNIKLDAFSDNSGRSPPAGSVLVQSFTVVGSTADAVTTTTAGALTALGGQTVSRETINLLHYLQIRFVGAGGAAIDPSTIDGNEIELRDAAGTLISLAVPIRVGTTDVFRYGLSADLATGRYTITILGGSFADVNGIANVTETETFTLVSPTAALTDPVRGQVTYVDEFGTRGYVDITFTPAPGATLNVAEILALRPTFSGGGAESLTITSVTRQGTSNVFRFAFTGTFTPGLVTMTLAAGAWRDSAGNASAATTNTFRLIAPAQSFFIELSGGLRLEAGGLTSEPLIDLSASVLLEIDNNRKLFILTFEGQLSIIKLGTVGATSGRFVLDNSDPAHLPPRLWGVASLQTNFDALLPYGLRLSASGTLQINLTNETKVETITLKGVGPGHTDLVQTYTLKPYSFGLELVGLAVVSIPGTSTELMRIQGGLLLDISMAENPSLTMFMTGTLSYGSGSVQITLASATAVLFIRTDAGHAGVAGSVTISAGGDIGLPNLALFSATGTVNLMFNTTLQDQTLELPASFLPLLREGDPTSITVYAAPPDLTGEPPAGAAPAAYVKATVRAQLVFAGVLVLDGYIGITAAGSGAGARARSSDP